MSLGPEHDRRLSFRCAVDGCRARTTPPSLRFLGPKVYLATVVVLVAIKGNSLRIKPRRLPKEPTVKELMAARRAFPPGYLHESWVDYLYWDAQLEA
jgi:hypothetical protein